MILELWVREPFMTMLSSKGCCRRTVCLSSDRKAVKPPPSPLCGKRRLKNSMNPQKSLELASGLFPGAQLGFLSYTWGFLLLVGFLMRQKNLTMRPRLDSNSQRFSCLTSRVLGLQVNSTMWGLLLDVQRFKSGPSDR